MFCLLQVTLENYYSNLIAQHIERKQRLAKLEESLKDDSLSEQQKHEKRLQHAQKETEFLRLKRSRLGVEDFEPLKVIGRGAFGEVRRPRIDSGSRAVRQPMSERVAKLHGENAFLLGFGASIRSVGLNRVIWWRKKKHWFVGCFSSQFIASDLPAAVFTRESKSNHGVISSLMCISSISIVY